MQVVRQLLAMSKRCGIHPKKVAETLYERLHCMTHLIFLLVIAITTILLLKSVCVSNILDDIPASTHIHSVSFFNSKKCLAVACQTIKSHYYCTEL